jgi:transcriptional regulator with XRE-family HTH domain
MPKGTGMSQLQAFIEGEMTRRDWNLTDLANEANLNGSVVSRLLKPDTTVEPELKTLDRIARALRVSRWQLVKVLDGEVDAAKDIRVQSLASRLSQLPIETQNAVDAFISTLEKGTDKFR